MTNREDTIVLVLLINCSFYEGRGDEGILVMVDVDRFNLYLSFSENDFLSLSHFSSTIFK